MPTYEAARFRTAAPLALVTIKSEQLGIKVHDVPMLLDTGADVTCFLAYMSHHSPCLTRSNTSWKHSMEPRSNAPVVSAELQFLGKSFRGQFLLIDGWHGVLGRNVLNSLSLLFDGPSRKWMEQR